MFAEEGDELLPESGHDTYVDYGYALGSRVFTNRDGGQFSRKDSHFQETVSVTPIDSLPEGAELSYGQEDSWRTLRREIITYLPFMRGVFHPVFYFKWSFKHDLKRLGRVFTWPIREVRYQMWSRGYIS
jgi:hypothetical protein